MADARLGRQLVVAAAGLVGLVGLAMSCSLGNVAQDDCENDDECVGAFGLGSSCEDGYCSDGLACSTAGTCQQALGYGVTCIDGKCGSVELDPRCTLGYPETILTRFVEERDRLLIGGLFRLNEEKDRTRAEAVRLAVEEMDSQNGVQGRGFGVVICDFGDPVDSANDPQNAADLVSHLGGEIGIPVIVGPTSSANATEAVSRIVNEKIDTLLISPSATGASLGPLFDKLDPNDPYGLFWRTCPSDVMQAQLLAERIDAAAVDKVALIYQSDTYGEGLRDSFFAAFTALSANNAVTTHAFAIGGDVDANVQMALTAAATDPAGPPDAVLFVSGLAARTFAGVTAGAANATLAAVPWFLTDGSKDQTLIDQVNASGDQGAMDLLFAARGTAPFNPQTGPFVDQLESLGFNPTGFAFVAHAYDATYAAGFATAYAFGNFGAFAGRQIAEGMTRLSSGPGVTIGPTAFPAGVLGLLGDPFQIDINGSSGELTFDPGTGDSAGRLEIWQATPAGFTTIEGPIEVQVQSQM